jgi:hypothetical protein
VGDESDQPDSVSANAAETAQQIKAAKPALKSWQATHPNDPAINTLLGGIINERSLAKDEARMGLLSTLSRL